VVTLVTMGTITLAALVTKVPMVTLVTMGTVTPVALVTRHPW